MSSPVFTGTGRPLKFDSEARKRFLEHFAKHARVKHAATAAGVTERMIHHYRKSDPEFAAAYDEARAEWRDSILQDLDKYCDEGEVTETFKDGELVSRRTRRSERLIELRAKKADSELREKTEIDMSIRGGVLVTPATSSSAEWDALFGTTAKPSGGDDK